MALDMQLQVLVAVRIVTERLGNIDPNDARVGYYDSIRGKLSMQYGTGLIADSATSSQMR